MVNSLENRAHSLHAQPMRGGGWRSIKCANFKADPFLVIVEK